MSDQNSAAGLWPAVDSLWARLEAAGAQGGQDGVLLRQDGVLLRILKLSEEVGEVAEAVIGATGQNPRKGVTHTWEDVQAELCDVAITALVALRTLTPDARQVFEHHLEKVGSRPLDRQA
ncbi:MazG-like family protein [Streptomyces sp. NPDC058294]|uniref:MazG-like family protein n=1 Tax=Streptomyces sp. NPDC058294 TaxID=3346430 RepID=UPI0036EECFB1